jgi:hypothetical protein
VPPAILAFLESTGYENAIRLAVSLGGDSDTITAIAGRIAQAHYAGVPEPIREQALERLDDRLRRVVEEFEARFAGPWWATVERAWPVVAADPTRRMSNAAAVNGIPCTHTSLAIDENFCQPTLDKSIFQLHCGAERNETRGGAVT